LSINKLINENIKLTKDVELLLQEKQKIKNNALSFLNINQNNNVKLIVNRTNLMLGFLSFNFIINEIEYHCTFHLNEKIVLCCNGDSVNFALRKKQKENKNYNIYELVLNEITVPRKNQIELFKTINKYFISKVNADIFNNLLFKNILKEIKLNSQKHREIREIIIKNEHAISLKKHERSIDNFKKIFNIKKHENIASFIRKMKNDYNKVFYYIYRNKGLHFETKTISTSREISSIEALKNGHKVFLEDMYYIINEEEIYNIKDFILSYNIEDKYLSKNIESFFIPYEDLNNVFGKELINLKLENF
jgi:hypothetical protein